MMKDRTSCRVVRAVFAAGLAGLLSFAAFGNVIRVVPGGTGDGGSWATAMALETALGAAQAGDEIRVRAGVYPVTLAGGFAVDRAVTVAGGYSGDDAQDEALADDPVTTFDGAVTYPTTSGNGLFTITAADGTVTLRRLCFAQAKYRGLMKTGAANLTCEACVIRNNGDKSTTFTGRGGYFEGDASVTVLTFTDCLFAGNGANLNDLSNVDISGTGAYFKNCRQVVLASTDFVTNGIPINTNGGRDKTHGGAFRATSAPVVATDCEFRGNGVVMNGNGGGDGGIVYLDGNCDGASFTSCRFIGNYGRNYASNAGGGAGGTLGMYGTGELTVDRCTFAYNVTAGFLNVGGGLTVKSGMAIVKDSIFYANAIIPTGSTARDIFVAGGACRVSNTIFSEDSAASHASGGGALSLADDVVFGDPCLVTSEATFLAALGVSGFDKVVKTTRFAKGAWFGFDAHLKSQGGRFDGGAWVADDVTSPGVDAASRDAAFDREPAPNGGRANLGGYGSTDEASKPPAGEVALAGEITVNQDADWTNPHFDFTLAEGGAALADVTVSIGATDGDAPGGGWDYVVTDPRNFRSGDAVSVSAGHYFNTGDHLYWKVVVKGHYAGEIVRTGELTVTNELPPFWTAGGDSAKVLHVWSAAPGADDGTSWRHAFRTLAQAVAAMNDNDAIEEIWLHAGEYVTSETIVIGRAVAIRGGFDGSECEASARTGSALTMVSGGFTSGVLDVQNAEGTVLLDRLHLCRSLNRAVMKTGAGDLEVVDSTISENGCNTGNVAGRGIYMDGASGAASLRVSNCLFTQNLLTVRTEVTDEAGMGLYLKNVRATTVEDTRFTRSGFAIGSAAGRDKSFGTIIHAEGSPITVERTRFAGIGVMIHGCGGIVYVMGASGGSVFRNCSFTGSHGESYNGVSAYGGALTINLSSPTAVASVENCTFAYNVSPMTAAASGLTVISGTVDVRNSIFYGNVANVKGGGAADIASTSNGNGGYGVVTVCNTLLEANDTEHLKAYGSGQLVPVSVLTGDPQFVTPKSAFTELLSTCNSAFTYSFQQGKVGSVGPDWFDVHLKSTEGRWIDGEWTKDDVLSMAIDLGDTNASYGNEPEPNGRRLNLGAYGNTAEASKSPESVPAFEGFTVDQACDWSQPHFKMTMGGVGSYAADVYVCYGATDGGEGKDGWEHVVEFPSASHYDVLDLYPKTYFQTGETVFWRVIAQAPYGTATETGKLVVTGQLPPWHGKGGGAGVIHVREGATGRATGANWTDAYPSLLSAYATIDTEHHEVWLAGAFKAPTSSVKYPLSAGVTVRGGFDGSENAPEERAEGTRASVSGDDSDYLMVFGSDEEILIERIDFSQVAYGALKFDGAGAKTLRDCGFTHCCDLYTPNHEVHAVSLKGGAATVERCSFVDNVTPLKGDGGGSDYLDGMGLLVNACTSLALSDSTFFRNGIDQSSNSYYCGRERMSGVALEVENTPVTVSRCSFVGHTATSWKGLTGDGTAFAYGSGSVVALFGACGGSSFVNCRFVGNEFPTWTGANNNSANGFAGALAVAMSKASDTLRVENCTFAYNLVNCSASAAGLTVYRGAATVRNSIFWGNVAYMADDRPNVAADLWTGASASAAVDYTLFASKDMPYVKAMSPGSITFGPSVYEGDPGLVTSTNEFLQAVTVSTYPAVKSQTRIKTTFDRASLNVHLRGRWTDEATGEMRKTRHDRSKAIDMGDPVSAWANEPEPNGGRVNLGAYGNTPWATLSPYGFLLMVK